MYFEGLSMRRSINCASAHQNGGFRWSENIEPITDKCSLCFAGFACKLQCCVLGKRHQTHAKRMDGSWNRVLKLSSCKLRRLKQFISCNLAVTCKWISAICLILLFFADFSYIFHRTALDHACLFTGV